MRYTICLLLFLISTRITAQKSTSIPQFGEQFITDSSSTLMLTVLYDAKLFNSNTKLALFGNYYANVLFYNFTNDSTKKLFDSDVFILSFDKYSYSFDGFGSYNDFMSAKNIFYRVRNVDYNQNKKIDSKDPVILYLTDRQGNHLQRITEETENVMDVKIYDKQNFALIKIQLDGNDDLDFDDDDESYYYVKLDLTTLSLGKKIILH